MLERSADKRPERRRRRGRWEVATAQVQIVPVATPSPSMGDYLAEAVKAARAKGFEPEIGPTGTVIEGDVAKIVDGARAMHEAVFQAGLQRVVTTIVIDDRRDRPSSADQKVDSLEERVERQT
jgi:uncharacterized protein (TIGR00106 family)